MPADFSQHSPLWGMQGITGGKSKGYIVIAPRDTAGGGVRHCLFSTVFSLLFLDFSLPFTAFP